MEPDVAPTVTIERRYFEILVHRAQLRPSDIPVGRSPAPDDALVVSKSEHEALQLTARRYANLCRNLMRGGVEEDAMNILCQDDSAFQNASATASSVNPHHDHQNCATQSHGAPAFKPFSPAPASSDRKPLGEVADGHIKSRHTNTALRFQDEDWSEVDANQDDDLSFSIESPQDEIKGQTSGDNATNGRPVFERQCLRTLFLVNLPETTTHADITNVVRGGMLLDIYLRPHDRCATVSFLHAADARAFFDHCRRHDLYIGNKRVDVRWNDRQYVLAGHVGSKISIGATRNLVVRRCHPSITEESIREDLDHIHNLVVVKVNFIGGSCFIGTNSVNNAMFARTCMMSRAKFKGSKIEWDADECAQAIERIHRPPPKAKKDQAPSKSQNALANRFQLLDMDGEDDKAPDFTRNQGSISVYA